MPEKLRKKLFYVITAVNFFAVAIYQFLTPYMSDDIIYMDQVREANSFLDLFAQEYAQYMDHSGRSVAHIILRIFLYIDNKAVFNVVAATAFTLLGILIYLNIDERKPYDIRIYLGALLLMWIFDPTISNSVFWETGACNYLFTAVIMLGFVTVYRKSTQKEKSSTIPFVIGMFLWGLIAGWCNENTSGGVIVFTLITIAHRWFKTKDFSGIKLWMITGLTGSIIGLGIMAVSPGNAARAATYEEVHGGIVLYAARFLKITLNIKNYYLVLALTFIVLAIAIAYITKTIEKFIEAASGMIFFAFMFLVICYALIVTHGPEIRSYYGASIFLMIGILKEIAFIVNKGIDATSVQFLFSGILAVLSVILLLSYIEDGANLARIKREFDERDAYLTEVAAKGEEMVVDAPMLRPGWENRFSMAYESDITEDKDYWINFAYKQHYKLWFIFGVDRETWTEY